MAFYDIETDYLIVLDGEGNIERVNPAFERALGRMESELLGAGMARLVRADDLAKFIRSFSDAQPQVFRLLRKETGEIPCRLIAYRFKQKHGYLVIRRHEHPNS